MKQATILVVTQLDKPVENTIRPSAFRKQCPRVGTQRAQQIGNCPVMPAYQNVFASRKALNFTYHLQKSSIFKPGVNREPERLADRFDSQSRTLAVDGILGSKDVVQFQRLPVDLKIPEIIDVSPGVRDPDRRQAGALDGILGVPDDQNDGVF
ncbi:MAG TPA: hypothetical protein VEC94_09480 [Pseudolabrys sp.]|nr:hypothetical protein [Pseudolabrys sp.]